MISFKVEYSNLSGKINKFAVETGRTREDVCQQALKSMVRFAVNESPPASAGATGKDAQYQGQKKIEKDLDTMGFRPVDLTGKHPENPLFADPDAYHHAYLEGNAVKTLFFVARPKYKAMLARLFAEVGKLLSGWLPAAIELGIPVPAWVYRHAGEGRGAVQLNRQADITSMTAVNHVPDKASAVYTEMLRRKAYWVRYAAAGLDRQLKAKLAGAWGK
jgi:hypothetical protein